MAEAKLEIDVLINNANAAKNLTDMRTQLRELQSAMTQLDEGSAQFNKLATAAGQLKDKVADTKAQVELLSGEKLEVLQGGLGSVAMKLANLDFAGAATDAKLLASTMSSMKVKDVVDGFKNLTSVFTSMGKALLTNPIFLLGGILIGIITQFDKLKSVGGIVGKIFTGIGNSIKWIVDGFKNLTDAIGLTNFQMEKLAETQKKLAEKEKADLERITNQYKTLKKAVQDYNLEKAGQGALIDKNIEEIQQIILDAEKELVTVREKYNSEFANSLAINQSYNAAKQKEAELQEKVNNSSGLAKLNYEAALKMAQENLSYYSNEVIKQSKITQLQREKKETLEDTVKLGGERIKQLETEAKEIAKAEAKANLLKLQYQVIDNQIAVLLEEQRGNTEGIIGINQIIAATNQQVADNLATVEEVESKILFLEEDRKKYLLYNIALEEKIQKLYTQRANIGADELAVAKNANQLANTLLGLTNEKIELEKKGVKEVDGANKQLLLNELDRLKILKEKYLKTLDEIQSGRISEEETALGFAIDDAEYSKSINLIESLEQQYSEDLRKEYLTRKNDLTNALNNKLITNGEYVTASLELESAYQLSRENLEDQTNEKILQARLAVIDKIAEHTQMLFNLEAEYENTKASIIEANRVKEINALDTRVMTEEEYQKAVNVINEKAWKEEEKLRRRTFIANKAERLAEATISGAQAVVSGLAQGGPILAGIYGTIAAAQIAIIAAQKYVPALESSNPNFQAGFISANVSGVQPSNAAIFGTGSNTFSSVTPFATDKEIKVVVLESDIKKATDNVAKVKANSTLK